MTAVQRRVEALAPWAAGLLLALPTLVAFYPPMTDLPYHEAAIGILRHFGDRTMFPRGLYELNLGEPNQLFHMLGWALSYVVSTRWAVKLVVAATIVALPPCTAHLARHVGASPLASLLVAPLAVGWFFYWGLITSLVGLAVLVATFPSLDRFARCPTLRGGLLSVGFVVLLYFAHEAVMFLYAAQALFLAVLYPWSPKRTLARLAPFAVGMAAAVAQGRWQKRFMTPAVAYMPTTWTPFWHKVDITFHIILPASEPVVLYSMSALCLLTIAGLVWLRSQERRAARAAPAVETSSSWTHVRAWMLDHRWELFTVACLIGYFAFPATLNGATLVYQRWFPPAFAVFAVVAAPRDLFVRRARVALVAVFTLPLATLLASWPSFADSSRAYRELEPLLARIEPGSAVAGLDLGPGDPTRTYSLGPASGRILATRGGRLAYAFTDSSVSPVVLPHRYQWTESLLRVGFESKNFRPGQDLHRYRYVLVRATRTDVGLLSIRLLAPEAKYVAGDGEWLLFESTFPVVPLLSHDFWLNGPPPESIRERIRALLPPPEDPQSAAR